MLSCTSSRRLSGADDEPAASDTITVFRPVASYDTLQIKYAAMLKVKPETIVHRRLYHFIEKWLGTPYKWGGLNESGIDCSAFLQRLLQDVYNIRIPRTSVQQFYTSRIEAFSASKHLSEGDLVFFRTIPNTYISHVGLYLQNRKFVNCSSSKGVSVASLDDPYWKARYVVSGRVKSVKK
jgi:lipoprotein Spr